MKKGRPLKGVVWPRWAIIRMKQLGLAEDLLNEALKVGIRTFEVDCCQLSQRVKSVNETWNTPALSALDGERDVGDTEPRVERESNLDVAEPDPGTFAGLAPEFGLGNDAVGPGHIPEVVPDIANIEVSRDASL